jgi:hypothetical protein
MEPASVEIGSSLQPPKALNPIRWISRTPLHTKTQPIPGEAARRRSPSPIHLNRSLLLRLGGLCLAALVFAPLKADPDPLEPAEKAAGDWIKIRLETTRIESEWLSDRPLLESTVGGLQERASTLEQKRDHVKATTAKDRDDIDALGAKDKTAADDLRDVDSRMQILTAKLIDLRPSLPPRLSEALDASYRSLAGKGMGTGERTQLAMTMLNRCAQFNRTVTCGEEVLSVDAASGAKSLETIYWGLSHAYALDRPAGRTWYGSPGPKGWQWEPLADGARGVEKLIAIYNDKADPAFVPVAATLSHPDVENAGK